jgi:hypothetical protein
LESASRDPWVSEKSDVLSAWGRLLAERGETAQAVEVLSQVLNDPAAPVAARQVAQAALARLAAPIHTD